MRFYKSAVFLSAIIVTCVLLSWIATFFMTGEHWITAGADLNITITRRDGNAWLVFFNDARYGPLFSVLTGISNGQGQVISVVDRDVAWHHFGVYYRYLHRPGAGTFWTLAVSMAYPFVLFAVLPLTWMIRRLHLIRRPRRVQSSVKGS